MINKFLRGEICYMLNGLTDHELYKLAKKRVLAKNIFIIHFSVYLIISCMMVIAGIWLEFIWFIFPVIGWGIAILIHKASLDVFLNSKNDIEKEFLLLKERQE